MKPQALITHCCKMEQTGLSRFMTHAPCSIFLISALVGLHESVLLFCQSAWLPLLMPRGIPCSVLVLSTSMHISTGNTVSLIPSYPAHGQISAVGHIALKVCLWFHTYHTFQTDTCLCPCMSFTRPTSILACLPEACSATWWADV